MADETSVNEQITDSVTQANVEVVSETPAMAMGTVFQTTAHSTGILLENAVNAQNQSVITAQAVTTACVSYLLASPGADIAALLAAADSSEDKKKD